MARGGRQSIGTSRRRVVDISLRKTAPCLCVLPQVPEETVLTDATGFHLGAGPYMLIYSRAVPEGDQEPLPWPEDVVVRAQPPSPPSCRPGIHITDCVFSRQGDVQRHNQIFLEKVTPDVTPDDTPDDTSGTVGASIPSSTSASGFTTPFEGPITPGEAMDVSN